MSRNTILFWLFFFTWLGARLYFMATTGLGDDETYYWDWSRHLAWSYYDHPPLLAWMIGVSRSLLGDNSFAIRLPAFFCTFVSAHFLFYLAKDLFDESVAQLSVALYLIVPMFSLGGLLVVPDAPMGALWLAGCYVLWQIQQSKYSTSWGYPLLGLILGLGFLSKYPMVLWGLSTLFVLAADSRSRNFYRKKEFYIGILLTLICMTPIVLWNAQWDWPSFAFHLRNRQTGGIDFGRWGQFWGAQIGFMTPFLFVGVVAALKNCYQRFTDSRFRFLFLLAVPTFVLFAMQSLLAEFKPHWTAPVYPLAFVALSYFYLQTWQRKKWIRLGAMPLTVFLCVALSAVFYVGFKTPIIAKIVAPFASKWDPRMDPTNDMMGWPELAERVSRLQSENPDLVLASWRYQLVAQIAYATKQEVYRVGSNRDQYTYWRNPDEIKDRSILYITDNRYPKFPAEVGLQDCQPLQPVQVYREIYLAHAFDLWVCKGIR